MRLSDETKRIASASVIAAAMIGVAFWISSPRTNYANALSTDEILRSYIQQDADLDGLPDWQEEVYQTDPKVANSVRPEMTDLEALKAGYVKPAYESEPVPKEVTAPYIPGEAPSPDSFTERFSQKFAEQYFSAPGTMTEAQKQTLVTTLLSAFVEEVSEQITSSYTTVSLRTDRTKDLATYADELSEIILRNDVSAEDADLLGLTDEVLNGDRDKALVKLEALAEVYATLTKELLALPAPQGASASHLALVRSFDSLSRATKLVTGYETDPVAALGGLSAFEPNAEAVLGAFQALAIELLAEGEPAPGTGAAMIVNIVRSAEQS